MLKSVYQFYIYSVLFLFFLFFLNKNITKTQIPCILIADLSALLQLMRDSTEMNTLVHQNLDVFVLPESKPFNPSIQPRRQILLVL